MSDTAQIEARIARPGSAGQHVSDLRIAVDGHLGYRCHVVIRPEEDGDGYTAFVPDLPGGFSEGDTIDEALANLREAVEGVLKTYLSKGDTIPWLETEDYEPEEGDVDRWIVVDA